MKRDYSIFSVSLCLVGGLVPLVYLWLLPTGSNPLQLAFGILNFLGWFAAAALLGLRWRSGRFVSRLATDFGIDSRFRQFESLLAALLNEVERKNEALLTNLLEKRISSKEELARTLERVVAQCYRLLNAESAELALFDKESGLYHSSFVLGKPFRSSAQAMLSGAVESGESERDISPDVLVQPIAFGGSVLGSLRVGLKRGSIPTHADRELMQLMAMQSGMAIINGKYTEELVRMKRASDESVKAKTGFLANLSHELRGPLGIMINAVELVLDGLCGPVTDDQMETLRMVKSNGQHLLELINDVLDYAKVESGKLVPESVEILVNDLIKDIASVVRAQADAKGHTLTVKAADEVLTIQCDRRHIRQMLINILTNAIKYTPEKGTIEMWAERVPGGKIKICVKDSGVGIEDYDREKVFAPFERIQNSYSINQVGTGLGMSLTRRLAEVNGGNIDFTSQASQGSTFWLVFPAVQFSGALAGHEENSEEEPKGKGELILLVESNPGERSMLAKYLTHLGYSVAAVATKGEAALVLRDKKVNLALVDNSVVDNLEEDLIKGIRDAAQSARLPLVLLSSRAFVFDIEKYLKAGVDRCLTKPISLKELAVICRSLIDGYDVKKKPTYGGTGKGIHTRVMNVDDLMH
ncbi:MAG: hypothetical protein DCC75_10115 [Proteobacteria bacterium]|nr:MAG: hypothetical protein DCC75_10115 [Pseudomonadota bacterium]